MTTARIRSNPGRPIAKVGTNHRNMSPQLRGPREAKAPVISPPEPGIVNPPGFRFGLAVGVALGWVLDVGTGCPSALGFGLAVGVALGWVLDVGTGCPSALGFGLAVGVALGWVLDVGTGCPLGFEVGRALDVGVG
jgi:hypothetical protein